MPGWLRCLAFLVPLRVFFFMFWFSIDPLVYFAFSVVIFGEMDNYVNTRCICYVTAILLYVIVLYIVVPFKTLLLQLCLYVLMFITVPLQYRLPYCCD